MYGLSVMNIAEVIDACCVQADNNFNPFKLHVLHLIFRFYLLLL